MHHNFESGESLQGHLQTISFLKAVGFNQVIPKGQVSGDGRIFLDPLSLFLTPQPDICA